mgnify:CR=1 FL=1
MKIFVVYIWMTMAYQPWDIVKVGEFANCEQGIATANNFKFSIIFSMNK